ncbi:MAG TPA: MnhB domain-containing protein [Terrimicrobiaceae bacterium]|nr:MnhB domain-containing protein [Terrimicrobiaceae bacterium]
MKLTTDSFLLRAMIGIVFLLVNIVSVYLLLRGHNLPGGGFIGGLMTGMSFILLGLVRGWEELQRELPVPPLRLATFGVLLAVLSGIGPVLFGEPFLTQHMVHLYNVPLLGDVHVGTPLVFDIGVFLLVSCITVKLVIVLARSTSGLPAFTPGEIPYYASELEDPIEDVHAPEKRHAD